MGDVKRDSGGTGVDWGRDRIEKHLKKLLERWADAELRGDTALLERTLADDFVGVGPRGFMLTKEGWLQRYESGGLRYESFDWDDVRVRVYGDAAVVTGRQIQKGKYQDHDVRGQFSTTLVLVKQQGRWLLTSLHLSPIADRS